MRIRPFLAALLTTALVGPTAAVISTAAPASAAESTRIVGASSTGQWLYPVTRSQGKIPARGDSLGVSIEVVTSSGSQVYDGSLQVQFKAAGSSKWKTVASASSAYLYDTIKYRQNGTYRAVYGGTGSYSSSSISKKQKVQRKVTVQGISGKRAGFKGKVSPKGKVKIAIQKKSGKKWKGFRTQKTDKKGRYTIYLPAPRSGRFNWKITFSGSKKFAKTIVRGYTY
ncbi:hypothetical protein GHK92_15335 [Nocardioides sp. dk4132]|uniref:hypothetical protein n=1 Tax=unclassified Nocardioides TaxID=2615069 RepID=UPI001294DA13|nr:MULTISPECIES: hypothetical protein [unclassified Nocardioides]MQW77246.1 hypothetical protein [Nocardioides sp. dk4132]QGA08004.1 hypothetical protein GFH29_11810 [Nocardioides sp. dk884]